MHEADLVRIELAKRRQEREVIESAAAKREKETQRLMALKSLQDEEMKLLEEKEAKMKCSSNRPSSALPPSEPKSDHFKFSVEHSKKSSSSSSSGHKATRNIVESKIETEPLYRAQPSSVPKRQRQSESADEYLQSALKDYPKLFEIRGEKKDICSPPSSPPKNEPKIPPKRPTSSYYRPGVPGAKPTQIHPETINLGENDSLPPTNRNSIINNPTNKISMVSGPNLSKRRNSTGKLINKYI